MTPSSTRSCRGARSRQPALAVIGEELRQDVLAVQADRAHPGEVVEPDLVDEDPLRLDAVDPGEPSLEADSDIAEPDRAMAGVEERPRHDPDRIGEVDDPGAVGGPLTHGLGDLEHHRDSSHRLRDPPAPVVSWPMQPQASGIVSSARRAS